MVERTEVEAVGDMLSEGEESAEVGVAVDKVDVISEARSSDSVEVIPSMRCNETCQKGSEMQTVKLLVAGR